MNDEIILFFGVASLILTIIGVLMLLIAKVLL